MPEHFWKCEACGGSNPPYTEVCRNCLRPAPSETGREKVEAAEPKPKAASSASDELMNEIYPFHQIKDHGRITKLFAFVIWSIQFIAILVAIISFNLKHMAIAVALIVVVEVINRKMLGIKRRDAKSAT